MFAKKSDSSMRTTRMPAGVINFRPGLHLNKQRARGERGATRLRMVNAYDVACGERVHVRMRHGYFCPPTLIRHQACGAKPLVIVVEEVDILKDGQVMELVAAKESERDKCRACKRVKHNSVCVCACVCTRGTCVCVCVCPVCERAWCR